jgi:outer membrane lipoprotein-sorting protein
LAGTQPLHEGYQVDLVQSSTATTAYRLRPLQDSASMRDLILRFDAEGLSALEFVDGIGQQHQLRFSARAAEIPVNTFVFVPPTGTEVIRSPALGADG